MRLLFLGIVALAVAACSAASQPTPAPRNAAPPGMHTAVPSGASVPAPSVSLVTIAPAPSLAASTAPGPASPASTALPSLAPPSWPPLSAQHPTRDAGGTLSAVLVALRAEDWDTLYDLSWSGLRAQLGRASYVAQIAAAWAGTRVLAARVITPITYGSAGGYFYTARAQVRVTIAYQGTSRDYISMVGLVWDLQRWSLLTIEPNPSPTAS